MTKLDRCWKNCLRMWKWITENWNAKCDIDNMKYEWLAGHGFRRKSIFSNACCFFCEHQATHGRGHFEYRGVPKCKHCPGVYVSKTFDCYAKTYHYENKPKAFYRKLLQLDAKRKGVMKNEC